MILKRRTRRKVSTNECVYFEDTIEFGGRPALVKGGILRSAEQIVARDISMPSTSGVQSNHEIESGNGTAAGTKTSIDVLENATFSCTTKENVVSSDGNENKSIAVAGTSCLHSDNESELDTGTSAPGNLYFDNLKQLFYEKFFEHVFSS